MRKSERRMIIMFMTPLALSFILLMAYPACKTVLMSFFEIGGVAHPINTWKFIGLNNYLDLFQRDMFWYSMKNMAILLVFSTAINFIVTMFFARIIPLMKLSKLWKSIVYLPGVITPVAMVIIWTQYVFNNKFGLLKQFFSALGMENLASIPWTSQTYSFWALFIAFTFGGMGANMVMFIAGMAKIPNDLYECADLEGASEGYKYWKITFPLMKDVTRTGITLYMIGVMNMFLWSYVFSPSSNNPSVVMPATYMYSLYFGAEKTSSGQLQMYVGMAAALGVLMCIMTVILVSVLSAMFGKERYEY